MSKLKKSIYCYETKEKFESIKDAELKYNIDSRLIRRVLNKTNKTCSGYHWCTDLSIFDNTNLTNYKHAIYCYETKEKFESIKYVRETLNIHILQCLNNPNRSAGGYHWCTDLSIFDNIDLTKNNNKIIYCYETKEKFESIKEAELKYKCKDITKVINEANKSSGGYHWCTSLDIFDNIKINKGYKKSIYCYETKEKFESIKEAAKIYNLSNGSAIQSIINKHNRTAGGYHWCTELSIFDNVELIYPDSGVSGLEKEVVDYIKLIYNKEIIENSRNIISPQELDIYIPDLNLAFEFNGNYWHSDAYKSKNYHIDKTNLCKSKGIQLIHIYEYQWNNNKEVWLSFIANKLKVNPNKFYARKCKIKLVESNISKQFQIDNHLQGSVNSLINLGLYHNDELISLMTFSKPRFNKDYDYELIRFCNKGFTNVIGGASKLLKYFEINFKPKSLLSYAEIDYSDGNLYSSLDFELLKVNDPNYVWIKQDVVLPRYKTMKHKLEKLLDNFDSNLTESENMENNDYDKIWKCGTYVFVKNY